MVRQFCFACMFLGFAIHPLTGCGASSNSSGLRASQQLGPGGVTPETVHAMTLAFGDDHFMRILETAETLMAESPSLEERARLNSISFKNVHSTIGIAGGANPIVGMTDMVVMVSLQREAIRRRAIDRTLTEAERRRPESYDIDCDQLEEILSRKDRLLLEAFTVSEAEIRVLAGQVFWPDQLEQLDQLIEEWWSRNPDRRLVSHVRLQDFAGYRAATMETVSSGPRNLLGLFYLDPFASMDPTTREIAQSRMLAERITYQLNRFPMLVSMQARGLLYEMLTTDELVSVRTTLAGTQASLERFADAVDRWPQEVAAQREAALDQLAEIVAAEREAAIADIEAAVSRQRDELLLAIDEQAEPLQTTLSQLTATLQTANTLSGSLTETVRSIDELDTTGYQKLVDSAADGVGGIERSLTTIERLLEPDTTDAPPPRIDTTVTAATSGTGDLVDHLFRRGVQLAAIVLVGWVIAAISVRLLAARLLRRPRGGEARAGRSDQ